MESTLWIQTFLEFSFRFREQEFPKLTGLLKDSSGLAPDALSSRLSVTIYFAICDPAYLLFTIGRP
jgi:hypothetical protein